MTLSPDLSKQYFDRLILIFKHYADDPMCIVNKIKMKSVETAIDYNGWEFSLPQLHQQCTLIEPSFAEINAHEFRQLLYKNPTHQTIKPWASN